MRWAYTPYVLPLVLSGLLSLFALRLAWPRRRTLGGWPFQFALMGLVIWSLAYAIEIGFDTLDAKIFWINIEYFGITIIPVSWFGFALGYTTRGRLPRLSHLAILALMPLMTCILTWTNDFHGLMHYSVRSASLGGYPHIAITYGVWFWIHTAFSYALLFVGTVVLLRAIPHMVGLYARQKVSLLVAVILPWSANLVYLSNISLLDGYDLTPVTFSVTAAVCAWALFRYSLFDLVPVAREAIIDEMSDGVVVLDARLRMVDINAAAAKILGATPAEALSHRPSQDAPMYHAQFERYRDVAEMTEEIGIERDGRVTYYEVHIAPLSDRTGRMKGRVVTLHDVDERRKAEMERERLIEALQRTIAEVHKLSGLLPICASCKKIRDDAGYWRQIEDYISEHSEAQFTHGLCPDCLAKLELELPVEDEQIAYD